MDLGAVSHVLWVKSILAAGQKTLLAGSFVTHGLDRLLCPRHIAVVGGGDWGRAVIAQTRALGFGGAVWLVHPSVESTPTLAVFRKVADLPEPPDAVFVGVNRKSSIGIIADLADIGAGGAVCFASGFAEAVAEDGGAADLQAELIAAAGEMPFLGPNCYGFVNALDRACIWPDQHGMGPVERGVAVLTQSSNIAINLTMQRRALPIAMMLTCGNMAQIRQATIAAELLDDPRITALGLHVEGFADVFEWHDLAQKAAELRKPVVMLKVGRSKVAQNATLSHTASLAGSDAGAATLIRRLGFGQTHDLATFLETLKLFHVCGPLGAPTLSGIACSGGEASLLADAVEPTRLSLPTLQPGQQTALRAALGPMVALSNPLDYHTYIWRDVQAMTQAWTPMAADHIGLCMSIVDYPNTDATAWSCATEAALAVRRQTGRPIALVSSLPELLPEDVATLLMKGGVAPMQGLTEAVNAAEIAAHLQDPDPEPPWSAGPDRASSLCGEADAKALLSTYGVIVPTAQRTNRTAPDPDSLIPPFALKAEGLAHKSEAGGVILNVTKAGLTAAAAELPGDTILIEEMVTDPVAELLIGVTRDPAHGFLLTLGAGGVLTELLEDKCHLILPASEKSIRDALLSLKSAKILKGYRGKPSASIDAVVQAIQSVQAFVGDHLHRLEELEINPLIATPTRAVAADALLRLSP